MLLRPSLVVSALLSSFIHSTNGQARQTCSRRQIRAANYCLKSKMLPPHTNETPKWKPVVMMVPNTLIPWMDKVIAPAQIGKFSLPQCFLFTQYNQCLEKEVYQDQVECSIPRKSHRLIRMGFEPLCAPEWAEDEDMSELRKCFANLRPRQAFKNCNRQFEEKTKKFFTGSRKSFCSWKNDFEALNDCWEPLLATNCEDSVRKTIKSIFVDDISLIAEEEGC